MVKMNLPVAAKRRKKQNLSNRHFSTTDFFKASVNYFLECVPNDKLNVAIRDFCQGYPLAGANLGQFQHHLHGFFVPFRTVMENYNDFIVNNPVGRYHTITVSEASSIYSSDDWQTKVGMADTSRHEVAVVKTSPKITINDLFYLFTRQVDLGGSNLFRLTTYDSHTVDASSYTVPLLEVNENNEFTYEFQPITSVNFDYLSKKYDILWTVYNSSNSVSLYLAFNLSALGRYIWTLLNSIGFQPQLRVHVVSESPQSTRVILNHNLSDEVHLLDYSALPILSLMKIFVDWFIPSKFRTDVDIRLREMGKYEYPFRPHVERVDATQGVIRNPLFFEDVFNYTMYPNDYFTNAFLYPNGSNSGESAGIALPDISLGSDALSTWATQQNSETGITNTPFLTGIDMSQDDGNVGVLSSYALRALRSLTNYVVRNRIAGYRTIDRFMAQFGQKLDYTQTNRCVLIKSNLEEFFPNVVTSQADVHDSDVVPTPESQQALLGGRASNLVFGGQLKLDYDVSEPGMFIVISSVNPKVGYVEGLDRQYLHLELTDYYQPSFDSLGVQAIIKDEITTKLFPGDNYSGNIFGYSPRYAEYKTKLDRLTGDFRLENRNTFLESLHTFRLFDDIPSSINQKFLIGESNVYDRIFQFTSDAYDHFQLASYNDVVVMRPTDTLSDAEEITDGNGNYIQMSIGGNHQLR